MLTVIDAVLHLGIGSVTVIPDVDAELALNDLWLERVTVSGVTITGNTVSAHANPLAVAIWTAAVGWVDNNAALIEETAYEQAKAAEENEFERRRKSAA